MFERFTREARRVVTQAEAEARRLGASKVEAEHLLLAMADSPAMAECGLGPEELAAALEREQERALAVVGVSPGDYDVPARPLPTRPPYGASAKVALERALRVTLDRGDRRIQVEHILLGVLEARRGVVPRALRAADVDATALRRAARAALDRR
jgi:D-alanyl-D-alanine carboxypeptidase